MWSRQIVRLWMRRAMVAGLAVVMVACSSGGNRQDAAPAGGWPVTDRAARRVVDEAVAASLESDQAGLCRRSANLRMCEMTLRELGDASVPTTEPRVLDSREVEPVVSDGGALMGGRLVEVCGVDGLGRRYRTEIMVIDDGSGPAAMNPVYWSGIQYQGTDETHTASDGAAGIEIDVPSDSPASGHDQGCPS